MDSTVPAQVDPAVTAVGVAAAVGFMTIYLAFLAFVLITHWKLYRKAGKPGWASLVPIYNAIVFCEIVGKPSWYWLLLLIPVVNIYPLVVLMHGLSRSFGKDAAYTVGLVLLGIVFVPMLAFGGSEYLGPAYAKPSLTVG